MTDSSEGKVIIMIELKPLAESDREQFIKDNQEAFNYGALQEFGFGMITSKMKVRSSHGRRSKSRSMAVRLTASCRTENPSGA